VRERDHSFGREAVGKNQEERKMQDRLEESESQQLRMPQPQYASENKQQFFSNPTPQKGKRFTLYCLVVKEEESEDVLDT